MTTVIFCGPSLSHAEARRLAGRGATVLPPARQGDVYRVLSQRPRAIALIDGVFESVPSVWHRELLAALDAGVAVFGASSMGALRAAELEPYGMVGVGEVFEQVKRGGITDDADVALLHAGAEHDFRPLTVPWVNAAHALEVALGRQRIDPRTHATLHAAARALHYQQRTWPEILAATTFDLAERRDLLRWLRDEAPDLKREDARACVRLARKATAVKGTPDLPPPPSHARVRQLLQSETRQGQRAISGAELLEALAAREDAQALWESGMRTLALAAFARSVGLRPSAAEVQAGVAAFLREAGSTVARMGELGLDAGQLRALGETYALERLVLMHAARLFPDGPSELEALALGARSRRLWRVPGATPTRRKK